MSIKVLVVLSLVAVAASSPAPTFLPIGHSIGHHGGGIGAGVGAGVGLQIGSLDLGKGLRNLFGGLIGHKHRARNDLNSILNLKISNFYDVCTFMSRVVVSMCDTIEASITGFGTLLARIIISSLKIIICILGGAGGSNPICGTDVNLLVGVQASAATSARAVINLFGVADCKARLNNIISIYTRGRGISACRGSVRTVFKLAVRLVNRLQVVIDGSGSLGKQDIRIIFRAITSLLGTIGNSRQRGLGLKIAKNFVDVCNKFVVGAGYPDFGAWEDLEQDINDGNDDYAPWAISDLDASGSTGVSLSIGGLLGNFFRGLIGVTRLASNLIQDIVKIVINSVEDVFNLALKIILGLGGLLDATIAGLGSLLVRIVAGLLKIILCFVGAGKYGVCLSSWDRQVGVTGSVTSIDVLIRLYGLGNCRTQVDQYINIYTKGAGIASTSGSVKILLQSSQTLADMIQTKKWTSDIVVIVFRHITYMLGAVGNSNAKGVGTAVCNKFIPACNKYLTSAGYPGFENNRDAIIQVVESASNDNHSWSADIDTSDGKTGFIIGGSVGGSTGGNTGGSTGGNTGGSTGGNTGGNAGGNVGGSVGGNTGSSVGRGTGLIGGLIKGIFGTIAGVSRLAVNALDTVLKIKIAALKDVFSLIVNLTLVLQVTLNNLISGLGSLFVRLVAVIIKIAVCILGLPGDRGICVRGWNAKFGIKGEASTAADLIILFGVNNADVQLNGYINKFTNGKGISSTRGSVRTVLEKMTTLVTYTKNYKQISKQTVTETFIIMTTVSGCISNSRKTNSGKEIVQKIVTECGKHFKQQGYPDITVKVTTITNECSGSNGDNVNWNGSGNGNSGNNGNTGGNTGGDNGNTGGNTGGDNGNTGGNTGGDKGNTGGNTGGDNGNTGGSTGEDNGNTGGNTGGDKDNTGGDKDNTGGNNGEDNGNTGGNTGVDKGNTSGNTGGNKGNTGGNTGGDKDNTGGNTGGDKDNTGGNTGEDNGNTGGNTGGDKGNTGGNTGGDKDNTGGNTGGDKDNTGGNTGEDNGNTGGNTGGDKGNTGGNTGGDKDNTGGNTGEDNGNTGGSTGGDKGNTGGNAGGDKDNTGGNTGGDNGNTGGNTGGDKGNTGGNTGGDKGNTGGNTGADNGNTGGNTGGDKGNTGGDNGNTGGNTGGDKGNTGGNTGSDNGNTDTDNGNTSGNTGSDNGNTDSNNGNTGSDNGNTGSDNGNTSGNTGSDSGNTGSNTGSNNGNNGGNNGNGNDFGVTIGGIIKVIPGVTSISSGIIGDLIKIKINTFVDIINLVTKLTIALGGIINSIISGLGSIFIRIVAVIFKIGYCVNGWGSDKSICTKEWNAQFGITGEATTAADLIALYRLGNCKSDVATIVSTYTNGKGVSSTSGFINSILKHITDLSVIVSSGTITKEHFSTTFINVITVFGSVSNSYKRGSGTAIIQKIIPVCGPVFAKQGFANISTQLKTVVSSANVGNNDKFNWSIVKNGGDSNSDKLVSNVKKVFKDVKTNDNANRPSLTAVLNLQPPRNFDDVCSFGVQVVQALGGILDVFIKGLGTFIARVVGALINYIVAILGAARNAKSFVSQKAYYDSFGVSVSEKTWAGISAGFKINNAKADLDGILNVYTKNKGLKSLSGAKLVFFNCAYSLLDIVLKGKGIGETDLAPVFKSVTTLIAGFANSISANVGKTICDNMLPTVSFYLEKNGYGTSLGSQSNDIYTTIETCNNSDAPWAKGSTATVSN